MEEYWQPPESNTESEIDDPTAAHAACTAHATKRNARWLKSEFDCHHWILIEQSKQSEAGSWSAELRHYLSTLHSPPFLHGICIIF